VSTEPGGVHRAETVERALAGWARCAEDAGAVGASSGVLREPAEETEGLYPGLVVHDGRVGGSITVGRSRLPLWALPVPFRGYDYEIADYGVTDDDLAAFAHHLFDLRGEFARLLLVLAYAERCESRGGQRPWWQRKTHQQRVAKQILRCLAMLEGGRAS
jgi:hypothetical protein